VVDKVAVSRGHDERVALGTGTSPSPRMFVVPSRTPGILNLLLAV